MTRTTVRSSGMTEIWRDIGDGRYQASSLGRVRNTQCRFGREALKPFKSSTGYWEVELFHAGVGKRAKVHRLVWEAFNGPIPEDRPQINHKDGVKTNNRIENLECVTGKENMVHASRTGLLPKAITTDRVTAIRSDATTLSIKELAAKHGICPVSAQRITVDVPDRKLRRVLSKEEQAEVRGDYVAGMGVTALSEKWGVCLSRIYQIVRPGHRSRSVRARRSPRYKEAKL